MSSSNDEYSTVDLGVTVHGSQSSVCRDIDQLNEVAIDAGWDCTYEQIQSGHLLIRATPAQIDRVFLVREEITHSLEFRGAHIFDHFTFMLMASGKGTRVSGAAAGEAVLWMVPPGYDLSMVTGPSVDMFTIAVPRDLLEGEILEDSPARSRMDSQTPLALRFPDKELAEFRSCVNACFLAHTNFSIGYDLQCLLVRNLANVIRKNRGGVSLERHRDYVRHKRLKKAVDFLNENLGRSVSVRELSEATGLSDRTLTRYFNDNFGIPPYQYSRVKRLEVARKALSNQTITRGSITNIAVEHGFGHLGRFSQEFRSHFGLLPSEYIKVMSEQ